MVELHLAKVAVEGSNPFARSIFISMKSLYLIRHAKSDWNHPGLSDEKRPLNERGLREASFMAQWLASQNDPPDTILSSHATRAHQTAEFFARAFHIPEEQIRTERAIYESSVQTLLHVIAASPNHCSSLLLVGHNYGLTEAVRYLAGQALEEMGTCAIASFSLDIDSWKEISADYAHLNFQIRPRELWSDREQ